MNWRKAGVPLLALVVAVVVMSVGPYAELAAVSAGSGGVLDETPRWQAAEVQEHLVAIGAPGRSLYRAHFWWDALFALANAVLLTSLLRWLLLRLAGAWSASRRWLLCSLPIMAGLCDLAENVGVVMLVQTDGPLSPTWVGLTAAMTSAKMILFAISAGTCVVLLLALVWRRSRRRGRAAAPRTVVAASSVAR